MDKLFKIFLFIVLLVALCASVCWTVFHFTLDTEQNSRVDDHEWLHAELGLTIEEVDKIEQIEESYADRRNKLDASFAAKQEALAKLLVDETSYSDVVQTAVRELHHIHGNLQALSIEHYYDMLEILPEKKRTRLKELATQALSKPE